MSDIVELSTQPRPGFFSPDLDADLRRLSDKDAAYGRMIDAAIARDNAGFKQATAEFWGGPRS